MADTVLHYKIKPKRTSYEATTFISFLWIVVHWGNST